MEASTLSYSKQVHAPVFTAIEFRLLSISSEFRK